MPPIIDDGKCIRCGVCADHCMMDVFYGSIESEVPKVAYPEECVHCSCCVDDCPVEGAIKLRVPLPLMVVYRE